MYMSTSNEDSPKPQNEGQMPIDQNRIVGQTSAYLSSTFVQQGDTGEPQFEVTHRSDLESKVVMLEAKQQSLENEAAGLHFSQNQLTKEINQLDPKHSEEVLNNEAAKKNRLVEDFMKCTQALGETKQKIENNKIELLIAKIELLNFDLRGSSYLHQEMKVSNANSKTQIRLLERRLAELELEKQNRDRFDKEIQDLNSLDVL